MFQSTYSSEVLARTKKYRSNTYLSTPTESNPASSSIRGNQKPISVIMTSPTEGGSQPLMPQTVQSYELREVGEDGDPTTDEEEQDQHLSNRYRRSNRQHQLQDIDSRETLKLKLAESEGFATIGRSSNSKGAIDSALNDHRFVPRTSDKKSLQYSSNKNQQQQQLSSLQSARHQEKMQANLQGEMILSGNDNISTLDNVQAAPRVDQDYGMVDETLRSSELALKR